MSYNLLFNTQFNTKNNWKFNNCYYEDGCLISTAKTFGIEQEIVLADATRLYFRCRYNSLDSDIIKTYIGIQDKDTLSVSKRWRHANKNQTISVVEDVKDEKIKVHLIFESESDINIIAIWDPILCDLNRMHKAYWLKFLLDISIKYRFGYNYTNLLPSSEIKPELYGLEKAHIGSIICTSEEKHLKIDAKLTKGKRYLLKLDYKPINTLGKVYLSYGMMKSLAIDSEQEYIAFRANDTAELHINIIPNNVLPYQLNLKRLLLIETEQVGFEKEDIPYLPFI